MTPDEAFVRGVFWSYESLGTNLSSHTSGQRGRLCAEAEGFVKIVIVSDIHANLAALEALPERNFDQLWCVGDLVDYGPRPHEVVHWVMRHAAVTPRSSHTLGSGNDHRTLSCCLLRTRYEAVRPVNLHDVILQGFSRSHWMLGGSALPEGWFLR